MAGDREASSDELELSFQEPAAQPKAAAKQLYAREAAPKRPLQSSMTGGEPGGIAVTFQRTGRSAYSINVIQSYTGITSTSL